MSEPLPPSIPRPLLVFDGDCSFCRRWIARWRSLTGDAIDYEPSQTAAARFEHVPREEFGKSVFLFEPDGRTTRGAHAVFRSLALARQKRYLYWLYAHIPLFARFSELLYRLVARNRNFFDKVDRIFIGKHAAVPASYFITQSIFLRALGLIYLAAFLSLYVQIDGLIGSHGILPASEYLHEAREVITTNKLGVPWLMIPSLTWISASDRFLHFLCLGGAALSLLLIAGLLPAPSALGLWLFYLSVSAVAQNFLGFQWDGLLLEVGFLAIFFAPLLRLRSRRPPSRLILFLLRWLLFRLMFLSAVVKLASHDPTWWDLTALTHHYETQPLPTWIAWYFQQFPAAFHKFSAVMVFAIEGVVPLLYFAPRRGRIVAFWITLLFQLLIMLTGNYGFFNLLSIVLCFTLLDDVTWPKWLRRTPIDPRRRPWLRGWILAPVAAVILLVTVPQLVGAFGANINWPRPIVLTHQYAYPFRSTNSYGLFAIMTTTRPEIIVEGSDDGREWREYGFKYKPGDVMRRPRFCQPHMPRLDWQMWFAALSPWETQGWFQRFEMALLKNEPKVIELLEKNPFPDRPPRYIRAILYDYRFTDRPARAQTGAWWTRKPLHLYGPVLTLQPQGGASEFRL